MDLKNQNILIIRGRIGSGKTKLVEEISKNLKFEKIIIDEIKKIVPKGKERTKEIFQKAGRRANELLKQGHNIVVEEAFLKKNYFDCFMDVIEQKENYNIKLVLLECDLETAILRKKDHCVGVIEHQFSKLSKQLFDNELVIKTDKLCPNGVYLQVEKYLKI